mmetsp:Transcript_21326/g.25401  ORF Transcript_21326/g.25401 Transcript_21326/m.25401 type:complete len:82 (-) Transcript_21326:45-290(-)
MALTQFPSTTESVKPSTIESNGDIIDNPAGKLNTDAVPSITLSDTPASPWMLNYRLLKDNTIDHLVVRTSCITFPRIFLHY